MARPRFASPALRIPGSLDGILRSRNPRFLRALALCQLYAPRRWLCPFIEGEQGTGKTPLARLIHALSDRPGGELKRVDFATLPESIACTELFGYERGAFTDARERRPGLLLSARGGTAFFDEIAKTTAYLQGQLLHAIQYFEIRHVGGTVMIPIDVRFIAASNVGIDELRAFGRMIIDLIGRLEMFRIVIPPLRDRPEDIPELVIYFVSRFAAECGYENGPPTVDRYLMEALTLDEWTDNVRGLETAVKRIMVHAEGSPVLTLEYCTEHLDRLPALLRKRSGSRQPTRDIVDSVGGNKTEAARRLSVDPSTIHRRLSREAARQTARLPEAPTTDGSVTPLHAMPGAQPEHCMQSSRVAGSNT